MHVDIYLVQKVLQISKNISAVFTSLNNYILIFLTLYRLHIEVIRFHHMFYPWLF